MLQCCVNSKMHLISSKIQCIISSAQYNDLVSAIRYFMTLQCLDNSEMLAEKFKVSLQQSDELLLCRLNLILETFCNSCHDPTMILSTNMCCSTEPQQMMQNLKPSYSILKSQETSYSILQHLTAPWNLRKHLTAPCLLEHLTASWNLREHLTAPYNILQHLTDFLKVGTSYRTSCSLQHLTEHLAGYLPNTSTNGLL